MRSLPSEPLLQTEAGLAQTPSNRPIADFLVSSNAAPPAPKYVIDVSTSLPYLPPVFTVIETPTFTRLWPDYWTEEERGVRDTIPAKVLKSIPETIDG